MFLISPALDNYYRFKLKNTSFRKKCFQKALDHELRKSRLGKILLRNLNEVMAENTNYHDEFKGLLNGKDYQAAFWESDLGYLWYKGNLHAQNTYFNKALDLINSLQLRSVLDVGCGWGEFVQMAVQCPSVEKSVGIDISESIIAEARNLNSNPKALFEHKDAIEITEKYDLITLFGSTDYIPPAAFSKILEKLISSANKQVILVNSLRKIPFENVMQLKEAKEVKRYDTGYVQPLNHLLTGLKDSYKFTFTIEKAGLDSALINIKLL